MDNIILYSTGCQNCISLKKLLDSKHINYIINDDIDEMMRLGFDAVPVLKVEDKIMDYNTAKEWVKEQN